MALGKRYKSLESAKGQHGKERVDSPASQSDDDRSEDGALKQHAEELLGVGGGQHGEPDPVARKVGLAIDLGGDEDQHGIDQDGDGG